MIFGMIFVKSTTAYLAAEISNLLQDIKKWNRHICSRILRRRTITSNQDTEQTTISTIQYFGRGTFTMRQDTGYCNLYSYSSNLGSGTFTPAPGY
jgi:hypothetical protein